MKELYRTVSMRNIYFLTFFILNCSLFLSGVTFGQNKKIDSLHRSIEETEVDSTKIKLIIELAREYHRLPNHETIDITTAGRAVDMALEAGDSIYYARALNTLGLLYRYHQQYDMAVSFHTKAYDYIHHYECYILDKMIFANNAGVAARYMADYETSVQYYQSALKLAEEHKNMLNIEIASNGLGNVYLNIPGQEDLGIEYFERALKTAEKHANKRGMAMNYLSLSSVYSNKKDYRKAREYLDRLMQINIEMGDRFGIGISHKAFGFNYLNEGKRLEKAEEYLLKSKEIFIELENEIQQAEVNYYLAKLYIKKGQSDLSIPLLENGLISAERLKNNSLIAAISRELFLLYKENNSYQKALNYHELWRNYKDSLNMIEQEIEVLALTKQYDLEKKESEIASLKNDQKIQSFLLKSEKSKLRNRSVILILIAALFATLFIIFFQKSQNRRFAKRNSEIQAELKAEKTRKIFEQNLHEAEVIAMRMKINPHFLFNSLNSIKLLVQLGENKKAIEYLVQLARFNREILELENLTTHPLDQELGLSEQYLKLEQKRFEKDFSYSLKLQHIDQDELKQYSIPPLLLQPFIENAIWHGLLPSRKNHKKIDIIISKTENKLQIKINDNGVGRKMKSLNNENRKGKGMEITKQRIALFNTAHTSCIELRIIDRNDEQGIPLGTSVILEFSPLAHQLKDLSYESSYIRR